MLEILKAQAALFGKTTALLKELSKDVKDLQDRVRELENARPPGYNEPDATSNKPSARGQSKENTISKTPAQDRLNRLRDY